MRPNRRKVKRPRWNSSLPLAQQSTLDNPSGATHCHSVENPQLSRAIELRRRLYLPETRDAVVVQMVGEYDKLKDWRLVADAFGVSHRTMSRFVAAFPALRIGAERARSSWPTPHGLAGFNEARKAARDAREGA